MLFGVGPIFILGLDGGGTLGLVHPRLKNVIGHKVGFVFSKNNDQSAIWIGLGEIS